MTDRVDKLMRDPRCYDAQSCANLAVEQAQKAARLANISAILAGASVACFLAMIVLQLVD